MSKVFDFLKYIYQTFIFTPLAGGNGKIQMAELVRAVMVFEFIRASIQEGLTVEQVYPDSFWVSMIAAICAIAAIQNYFKPKDDGVNP
jgi:hypothetical protein